MMMSKRFWQLSLMVVVALSMWVFSPPKVAQAATCTSNATGNWATAGTWTGCGGLVPQNGDDVIIAVGHTVTLNGNTNNLASLTVNGTLNMANNATARTMTVSGAVTINAGGTMTVPAGNNATSILNIGGNFTNNGTFQGRTDADSRIAVTFNGAANQLVSGTGATNNFHTITVNKPVGTVVNFEPTNFTLSAGAAAFLTLTSGVFRVGGTFTLNHIFVAGVNYTIAANAGFWLDNPNVTVTAQAGDVILNGSLRVTQGTYNIGTAAGHELRYVTGSTFNMEGGNMVLAANFRPDTAATSTINFSMSGGTLTLVNVLDAATSGTTGSFHLNGGAGSSFTMSGGTIAFRHENTGFTLDYRNLSATTNITGGTVQFGTNTSPAGETFEVDVVAGTGTNVLPNVVINQTNPPTLRFNRPVVIQGSLTINTGSTLNANAQPVTISGNWTNNGTFTSGVQTTTFNGTADQTIGGSSVTGFSTMTVNSGSRVIIPDTNIPTASVAVNNNGELQQTRTVNNATVSFLTISTDRYRGVDITTAANLGSTTVRIKGNSGSTCTNHGGASPAYVLRCFDITPTNQAAATVTLWAITGEQNGIPTANLAGYRYVPGTGWIIFSPNANGTASNNYIQATGDVAGFSGFLLGNSAQAPTAVQMNDISAVSASNGLWVVFVALVLVLAVATGWHLNGRRA